MGLILDSSVVIKAERQGQNARQMLTAISRTAGILRQVQCSGAASRTT